MIVVAEGVGSAVDIGHQIHEKLGIEPRITVLGHIQRGGSPTARDRETATRMGYHAVMALANGIDSCIIATQEGGIVEIAIEEALSRKKTLQEERYRIMETMQYSGGPSTQIYQHKSTSSIHENGRTPFLGFCRPLLE
jgi:6-phosphofructokinase 1